MRIFITGGTGFIGSRLVEKLVYQNHTVVLLVRDPARVMLHKNDNLVLIQGDLFSQEALRKGMSGCDWVFHMAALTKPWSKDPQLAYETNVTGTVNVMEAAIYCNVSKVVFTSTGGTMSFSKDGLPVNELTNPDPEYHTLYEKTKAEAEKITGDFSKNGLNVVIVNPTRVFGPGRLSESNSVTKIIKLYISGLWRIIPGSGKTIGNYAYIEDVVDGHIFAAHFGRGGERYILGGENLSFNQLLMIIGRESGCERKVLNVPVASLKMIIKIMRGFSKITGIAPLITEKWLDKYLKDWILTSDKAERELGYKVTPFSTGVAETIKWITSKPHINS